MKRIIILVLSLGLTIGITFPLAAMPVGVEAGNRAARAGLQRVTPEQAQHVARNWVALIVSLKGNWGGSPLAEAGDVQPFMRGERQLGYFAPVKPQGFVVVSLWVGLEPVKAYSEVSDLEPELDTGMADLIKGGMERILNALEKQVGPLIAAQVVDLSRVLEIDYTPAWQELLGEQTAGAQANYQAGQVLLTSSWHQDPPYNDQCPWMNCSNANGRAIVGCVATAGAQIMRYWNWPPYGVGSPYNDAYDWPNMRDSVTTSSPQAQIDAVAELSYEVGLAVGMSYGCSNSSAYTYDMVGVYENQYRYSTAATRRDRDDYSAVDWFNRIKAQLNVNRPVHYRIPGHSIVGDGWQEIGSAPTRQYHMNYGWGGSYNAWYTLDALYGGDPDDEYMIEGIYPAQALGSYLSGVFARQAFPYRYFDQDAYGNNVTFDSGQYLQFLQGVWLKSYAGGGAIQINGASGLNTRIYTRGNPASGARIYSGAIRLSNGGGIRLP